MQTTSELYNQIMADINHRFEVKLSINGVDYGVDSIFSAKTESRIFENKPSIGGCYSATLDFSIISDGASIPRMASVVPYFRVVNDTQQSEWIQNGLFFIDQRKVTNNGDNLSVFTAECFDAMLKANAAYSSSSLSWPAVDTQIVAEISSAMGVPVDPRTTAILTKGFTISDLPINYTYRDVLSFIAVAYAGNWIITDEGKLRLVPISGNNDTLVIDKSLVSMNVSPKRNGYTKVVISTSEETAVESGSSDDMVMEAYCPYATQTIADDILTALSVYRYEPFEAGGVWSDPAVEIGDKLTAVEKTVTIYARTVNYGPGMVMNLSAPDDGFIDHEYAYESPSERHYKQTLGDIRREIVVTAESITSTISRRLDNMQEQIDNNIETFTGPAVPTLTNYPANAWTTTEEKDKHIGDLYVVNSQGGDYEGFYYRFEKNGSTYQWRLLKDTEVTKALADAEEALRRVGIAETQIEQNAEAITLRATKTEAQGYANTAQANAINAAASDATTKANAAESAAKTYADAQITVSADAITSNVSATYETKSDSASKLNTAKTYAEGQASAAERGAKNYTDGKLADYSTTAQMNSAITQSAASITSTVSATYETKADATSKLNTAKTYAETQASAAEDAANDYTDGKLVDYSTTTQMESAIEQSASQITQTVAATYTTKEAFNNLEIGGRNYAWAVDSAMHDIAVQNCTYTYNPDNNGEYVLVGGNGGSAQHIWHTKAGISGYDVPDEIKGKTLLFHADHIEASGASPSPRVWLVFTKNGNSTLSNVSLSNDSLSKTVTVPTDAKKMYILIRIRQTSPFIDGETMTVRGIKLEKGNKPTDWTPAPEDAEERISKAEAELIIQADEIASKVSETDFNGNTIASKINQTATTVKINAQKIDLQGAVTISDFNSSAQATLVKNTTTKNQYAQSASNTTAPTSGWQDTIPAYNATNKYIWIRVETTKTFADNSTDTSRSTPVVDINLTKSIQDAAAAQSTATGAATAASTAQTTANNAASAASTAQTTANNAASTAAAAQTKANAALVTSVSVYFRASTSTVPGKPTAEVTSTAVDTSDAWTLCMPRPKKGTTYYTCEQNKDGNGTVSWTAVRQMANTTYVASWASSANATYIDGANIYTGTVTADKIAANEVLTQKLTATDFTITGGSIQIDTQPDSWDIIKLNSGSICSEYGPSGINVFNPNYSQINKALFGTRYSVGTHGAASSRLYIRNLNPSGDVSYESMLLSTGIYFDNKLTDTTEKVSLGVYNGAGLSLSKGTNSASLTPWAASLSNGTASISLTPGAASQWLNGASKYSALIWPDSNGAGRFILGDGKSTKWRTELTNSGLVFRNASDKVTAKYASSVTTNAYTPSNDTLTFGSGSKITCRKTGIHGIVSLWFNISNGDAFAKNTDYTIFTLPTDYRPAYKVWATIPNNTGNTALLLTIGTDGVMIVFRYSSSGASSTWSVRAEIPVIFANP